MPSITLPSARTLLAASLLAGLFAGLLAPAIAAAQSRPPTIKPPAASGPTEGTQIVAVVNGNGIAQATFTVS